MEAIRMDMFGDGKCMFEYVPHSHIIVRAGGFKIQVRKPYSTEVYGQYYLKRPAIIMSTNASVYTDLKSLQLMQKAVNRAVEILNNENDGNYINPDFTASTDFRDCVNKRPEQIENLINQGKAESKATYIKNADVKTNAIYADAKGNLWIFAGVGRYLEHVNGKYVSCNRLGCDKMYIDYTLLSNLGRRFNIRNGSLVVFDGYIPIDSQATYKKFVQKVSEFDQPITRMHVSMNELEAPDSDYIIEINSKGK